MEIPEVTITRKGPGKMKKPAAAGFDFAKQRTGEGF
jgi:hypothetical protein